MPKKWNDNRNWKLRDKTGEVYEVRVAGNFTTNYGEVITEAALADAGIALKSLWDIQHLLAEGLLCPVLADYTIEPLWYLWAVRPPGQMVPSPLIEAVGAGVTWMSWSIEFLQPGP